MISQKFLCMYMCWYKLCLCNYVILVVSGFGCLYSCKYMFSLNVFVSIIQSICAWLLGEICVWLCFSNIILFHALLGLYMIFIGVVLWCLHLFVWYCTFLLICMYICLFELYICMNVCNCLFLYSTDSVSLY